MPQGLQAVLALALLLPGFVSARIVRVMSQKTPQTELERVIEALILSFFTYLLYIPFYVFTWKDGPPINWHVAAANGPGTYYWSGQYYRLDLHGWRLLWIPAISIILGLVWGYAREKDLLLRCLRKLRMTERSSYESVWADVLQYIGGNVQVGLGDGRSIVGWLRQYSLADGGALCCCKTPAGSLRTVRW